LQTFPTDVPCGDPPTIALNALGLLPGAHKKATVPAGEERFAVRRASDGATVFEGECSAVADVAEADGGGAVRVADFSEVREAGTYFLEFSGGTRSAVFEISETAWNAPYKLVTRAMYLWRCGCGVSGVWKGETYAHGPCHLEDGYLDHAGGPAGARRPSHGGWHDAGDYNKYTVNAGVTVGLMFKAWEHFPERIGPVGLELPESGNGVPDLLNELRYELDWLLTMPFDDGRVSHKISAPDFSYFGPPDHDPDRRYFCPWGTAATATFVAMAALAARHFRPIDAEFAGRCLAAARKSWGVLLAHPERVDADQSAFKTGPYGTVETSHRLWAAAELWETGGEPEVLAWFERNAAATEFTFHGPMWQEVTDLALGTYLESSRTDARHPALVERLEASLARRAAEIVAEAERHPYGRPLGSAKESWFWGDNGSVAAQTYLLHLQDRRSPDPRLRGAAHDALSFLFGRNVHGRSYVTGLSYHPPEHPHDRRGGAWPGHLVGGPWPDARQWFDEQGDFRTNEIAINWNASLIYALAAFVDPKGEFPILAA